MREEPCCAHAAHSSLLLVVVGGEPFDPALGTAAGCCCSKRSGPMEKCTGAAHPPTQAWLVEVGRRRGTVVRSFRPDVFTGAHGLRFREVAKEMRRLQQLKHKWVAGPAAAVRGLGGFCCAPPHLVQRWDPMLAPPAENTSLSPHAKPLLQAFDGEPGDGRVQL